MNYQKKQKKTNLTEQLQNLTNTKINNISISIWKMYFSIIWTLPVEYKFYIVCMDTEIETFILVEF